MSNPSFSGSGNNSSDCPKLFIPRKNSLQSLMGTPREREFTDQMANWLSIEQWANNFPCGGGSGVPWADAIVVAHDAVNLASYKANPQPYIFFATGASDDSVIQSAVNYACGGSGSVGGFVLLTDGNFTFASDGYVIDPTGGACRVSGFSNGSGFGTEIHLGLATRNANPAFEAGFGGTFGYVEHLSIQNDHTQTFDIFGVNAQVIDDVFVDGNHHTTTSPSAAFVLQAATGVGSMTRCGLIRWGTGGSIGAWSQSNVAQMQFINNQLFPTAGVALHIDGQAIVEGNYCVGGGMVLSSTQTYSVVVGNTIQCGGTDMVQVSGVGAMIQGNRLLASGSLATNGINILAGSTAAMVTNNYLHGCATNTYVDAGAGTINAAGNYV